MTWVGLLWRQSDRRVWLWRFWFAPSFDEAPTAFADPFGRLEDDDRHSVSEPRLVLLGRSSSNRLLAVMFTDRGAERIRLISARQATRFERRQYEEART